MSSSHIAAVILGIDPGLALNKPMAMTLVKFREDGTRHLLSWWGDHLRVVDDHIEDRISGWLELFELMLQVSWKKVDRSPDMVVIEDVRRHGRGGAHMQCLITFLKERAEKHGIRAELVHPSSVKLHATGYGKSTTPEVALFVRSEYAGADRLPVLPGEHDWQMALAIAGAGYAILQKEALEQADDVGIPQP